MARARVELMGSLSHTRGGRKFERGKPQVLTNAAEILYYQNQSDFAVTMEEAPKKKAKAAPPTPPAEEAKGDGDDYTEEQLKKMKKNELLEVADELELLLEGSEKKSEMIEAILEAQKG